MTSPGSSDARVGPRATLWLIVGAFGATAFIFGVSPTPFDALDFRSILLPYLEYYRGSLGAGEFPFWNPYASLGRPFAADPQAIVFWPGSLAYLSLGIFWGTIVLAWLHAAVAAWATARLCLRLGALRAPALAAGLVFVLSGKLTGHYQAGHVQFVISYLLLPLLLDAALTVQWRGDRRAVAWLAAVAAWQLLAGAPQVFWNCALAVALLLAGLRLDRDWRKMVGGWWQDGWRVAAAYALCFAVAGVAMVPLAELVQQSNRAAPRPDYTAIGSLEWRHWLSALTPSVAKGYTVDWELLLYPGMAVTLLGVVGLTRVRDQTVRALGVVALAIGVIAAGEHTPFFPVLFKGLPGYASFRVHGRSGAVLVLVLIVAATLLLSARANPRRQLVRVGAGVIAVLVALGLMSARAGAEIARPLAYLAGAGVGSFLWFGATSARWRVVGGLALAGGLALDLVRTDAELKHIFVTSRDYAQEAALVEALRESGQLIPGMPPPRVFAPPKAVRANAGMIYGFGTFAGSEALALQRVWSYVHWAVGREPPELGDIYAFEAFAAKGAFPVPWVAQSAALDLRARRIEVQPAPERAWLVGRARLVGDWREAGMRLADGHDARQSALLEPPAPADWELDQADRPDSGEGSVRWRSFSRNRLVLETHSPGRSILTVAEAWYPGWRATVNGADAAVFPVNGWMRGVVVPAGEARVEFRYWPTHFLLGGALTLAALGVMAWLARPLQSHTAAAEAAAAPAVAADKNA